MQYANRVLNEYKGNQNAWTTVDKILELCQDNNAKFFALQILDEAINVSGFSFLIVVGWLTKFLLALLCVLQSRWNIIDADSKLNMRNFMITLVLNTPD